MSDVCFDERRQDAFSPLSHSHIQKVETVTIRPFRIPYPDVICIRNNRVVPVRQIKGNERTNERIEENFKKKGDVPTMRRSLSVQTCAREIRKFYTWNRITLRPTFFDGTPYIGVYIYTRIGIPSACRFRNLPGTTFDWHDIWIDYAKSFLCMPRVSYLCRFLYSVGVIWCGSRNVIWRCAFGNVDLNIIEHVLGNFLIGSY